MAERRMFSKAIIDSDAFLDMPISAQCLYFHLNMRADDEGFVGNPRSIMRNVKASDDDMKILIAKRFVLTFDSGIIVIKHWKIHNYIRGDRLKSTTYVEEKEQLKLDDKMSYTERNEVTDTCLTSDGQVTAQDRIGKDRLDKDRIDQFSLEELTMSEVAEFIEQNNLTMKPQKAYIFIHRNNIINWKEELLRQQEIHGN